MAAGQSSTGGWMRRFLFGASLGSAAAFFAFGIIFWGGFNTGMEATNTMTFCISCHEMKDNVYAEYAPTIHHSNRTGVGAVCSDCHVPKSWVYKFVRKIQASNELLHKVLGTVSTPEKFNAHRLEMAKRVWKTMKSTDSRECRNCHEFQWMNPAFQKPRARAQHLNAFKTGQTCIDCHKGIAHKEVRSLLSEAELEELEKPDPAFIREVPQTFLDGLKKAEERDAAKEAEEKAAAARHEQAIKDAVAAALAVATKTAAKPTPATAAATPAAAPAASAAPAAVAAPSATATGSGGWDNTPGRDITLFYPGQSSMEWVLTGKEHGGARPYKKGDRCTICHDKEAADMGKKIVTGEKLEPTVIAGKRGSIPVNVKAAHDDEYLYMRFAWKEAPHAPVPFAPGGKMDPENSMKLALMFATDEVEHAARAGCWGTCHHDARTMPHAPEGKEVSKYIVESRTAIEIEGKNDAKRGGWDKLKDEAALQSEMAAGHFMDIVRFKSGNKTSEDGHILADRVMTGGSGAEFDARLDNGEWVVEMRRKLKSDKPGDITFDLARVYNFGFAIHDDHASARFHHVSLGYRLGFDKEDKEIEINAVKR